MNDVISRISAIGIMPVIGRLESTEDCDHLAAALKKGGIPAMEITFRMEKAETYIKYVREKYPDMLTGAGTVITMGQAEEAINAGAQFVVTPGLNPEIVKYCQSRNTPVIPGVSTASEIETALGLGLKNVKFFPAEPLGGVSVIKALCGPYKNLGFMPTGGLNLDNIQSYFAFDKVICCGGSYMLGSFLAKKDWAQIAALCRKSVQTMLGLKLAHIGINNTNEKDAAEVSSGLSDLLKLDVSKDGPVSTFLDGEIEVMKVKFPGTHGHIAFSSVALERAVRYFKFMGAEFDESTAQYDDKGHLKVIYFKNEIGGFAIHLNQA